MPSTEHARTRRGVTAALAVLVLVSTPVDVLASTSPSDTATVDSTPTTEPETDPDTTEPDTTAPDTTEPGTTSGEEATGTDATALTWVAIVAAIGLLGIAVWWMVRGSGRSGPVSRMDDDWPGDSEVI